MGKEKVVKKSKRVLIKLLSRAGTGYFYTKSKNTRNTPGKLELLKFDPIVGKHVLFTETKLKGRICCLDTRINWKSSLMKIFIVCEKSQVVCSLFLQQSFISFLEPT
ncbi:50S ribosomal protein L33 [Galdieria sulphuraria]|nr:50S ribosomal protein L33 [Galdieria sulphuraria]